MMTKKATHYAVIVFSAIIGLVVFALFLEKIQPYRAANFKISRDQALEIAENYIHSRGFRVDDYHSVTVVTHNSEAFTFFQKQLGLDKTIEIFANEDANLVGFHWRILWYKNLPKTAPQERFRVDISVNGEMIGYQHEIPENMDWPRPDRAHLSQEEAYQTAVKFLRDQNINISGYAEDKFTSQRLEKRTDHTFTWRSDFGKAPGLRFHTLTVQGDEVGQYDYFYELPENESFLLKQEENSRVFSGIISITAFFLTFLFLIGVFARKYHEGEVSMYTATAVFIALWITLAVTALINFRISTYNVSIGELSYDAVAIGGLIFMGLIAFPVFSFSGLAAWSVGESLAREGLSRKLASLDAIINRRFSTIQAAQSVFFGYGFGLTSLGIITLLGALAVQLFNGAVSISGYSDVLSVRFGFLIPVLSAISGSLLAELMFRLFGNIYFFKLFKRKYKWAAAIISSLFWAVYSYAFWDINLSLSPIFLNYIIALGIGLIFCYIFWKYDLLTVIIANFVMTGVMKTIPLLANENDNLWYSGLFSLALLSLPLIFMVRGSIKKEHFEYRPETTPAHIKRISERERLQKELEIARQVQMRLLPKESPLIPGCDIAGICIPAKEVGGDYYDFILMNAKKVGMVIGDVSGKGVPAAIYMTLTKGIFQSHAEEHISPKDVLVKVNSLMYRTIERGSFVSMFYAVLDVEHLSLKYARAGHNPAIYIHCSEGNSTMLQPRGIALGLEEGDVFRNVIVEKEMSLSKSDLLVFYTDGFTEAMNKHLEEYGEDRLLEIVRRNENKTAREIIDSVYQDVKSFVKEFPQHDDMTMVVAKIV